MNKHIKFFEDLKFLDEIEEGKEYYNDDIEEYAEKNNYDIELLGEFEIGKEFLVLTKGNETISFILYSYNDSLGAKYKCVFNQ